MEHVTFVALFCYFFCITTGTEGQIAGDVQIESCKDGLIDIREKAINTILCKGFNPEDTIRWTFKIKGSETPVATCDSDNCTVHEADHFTVERSPRQSKLFYQQYDREVDIQSTVTCTSQLGPVAGTSTRSKTCSLNVINPAELSNCTVEEDRDSGTVTGRCRFDHAYSYFRAFTCTWYQEKDGQSRSFRVNIEYDSGSLGPSGWCTFNTTLEPGTYTYSINFYPGPAGNITVNVENITTSPKTQEENDLRIGALVGGVAAVVVVIIIVAVVAIVIIVVVVVVVCVRKRRKRKPAGSALWSSNDNATENKVFEEHVSPTYSTSDGPDASQQNDENTYEVPAPRPPNAEQEHVYNDSNTATTTTTTTPSHSITTTTGDLHNTTTNQRRGQGKKSDNVHHNPVYVNENQPGEESSGLQQHPTYANDHHQTAQGDVAANRDSNPYYSEIKDTGIN
ncbi:uncharacterized protein [Littorina saxatilis]|uniref:uncharacterized protein n=1 Tax=Littorina saxatilis TaxID=31220 RepID=UPI0038B4CACC